MSQRVLPNQRIRRTLNACVLTLAWCCLGGAQTTAPPSSSSPPSLPSPPRRTTLTPQQDAARPPGTEQRSPIPADARPGAPSNPTAPPAVPTLPEQRRNTRAPADVNPNADAQPAAGTNQAGEQPLATTEAAAEAEKLLTTNPLMQTLTARPLPPRPDLMRLGVASDRTLAMTLNDAVRRALENNNDIEVARGDVRFAETTLRSLEGVYDPVFRLTPLVNYSVTPTSSALGGGRDSPGRLTQTDLQLNPSVDKFFGVGGGQYQVFYNNLRRTTNSAFTQLNPFYSANLGVTFTQPLVRNRSIDIRRRDIRVGRRRLEQSDADFRRLTIDVIAQVQRAYWELVFALRDVQNRVANLDLVREQFRTIEARVAEGSAPPLERAEVETQLATREAELMRAARDVTFAENNLKRLIVRDPLAAEWSAQLLPTDQPTFDDTPINLPQALAEARANRPELRRVRLQQNINDIDTQFLRNQTRPRIDIEATLATTGLAGTQVTPTANIGGGGVGGAPISGAPLPTGSTGLTGLTGGAPLITGDAATNANAFLLDQINQLRLAQGLPSATVPLATATNQLPGNFFGGYGQTLSNVFGFDTRSVVIGVAIEVPFRNQTAKANLAGARVQREQLVAAMRAAEQTVETEVRNAAQDVETARRTVLLTRAARRAAELQVAGERQLFAEGRSTTFLIFERANQLVNARTLELRAETDYNRALADLQRASSTTLQAMNVNIEASLAR